MGSRVLLYNIVPVDNNTALYTYKSVNRVDLMLSALTKIKTFQGHVRALPFPSAMGGGHEVVYN